ncbi:hypothetical protein [Nonlabens antarcticus]|uniref:hypothetical protein n=1 Tax=Nonlabens antarcticus TaxID=392714 RepID=UPI0018912877|nr:hypothetical protein [Nonlabens antarcticus]
MRIIISLIILVLLLISCQNNTSKPASIATTKQFPALEGQDDKTAFLQEIFDADQSIRTQSNEIKEKYGVDSDEDIEFAKSINAVDDANLEKIGWYLEKYDYPDMKIYGETISLTPALVVHHSIDKNVRRTFYPKFKSAYDNGLLKPDFFALYLGRIYEIENGSYFRMKSPYQIEDQIDSLIVELNLED